MKHPDENQLILYHYGEPVERAWIESHLAACELCQAERTRLDLALNAVSSAPLPERPENYGQEVWQRLRPLLPPAPAPQRSQRWTRPFLWPRWMLGGAVSALVLLAFLAGRFWPNHREPLPAPISSQVRDRILMFAVADHLESAAILLMELDNSGETGGKGDVDISWQKARAQELVAGNRIIQQTAERAGETGISSVLDDLGRVLLMVAHSPSSVSPAELDGLRKQIEDQGILFKIQVVNSRLRERARSEAEARPQGHFED